VQVEVDRTKCQDHGQCMVAAPAVFSLDDDDDGKLACRALADTLNMPDELDDSLRDDIEEAADVCPLPAILVRD
jgi:ferredoxin